MIQLFREAINIINNTNKVIDVSLLKDMPDGIIDLRVILTRMSGAEGENHLSLYSQYPQKTLQETLSTTTLLHFGGLFWYIEMVF